ncbi:MAG: GNAT family N-acetyltransferase [Candidatus Bathyarchaeota archaeon]|nr:MAG: GNAT family N-acetyltransferase [Candidatus Bathyarchaeota archaeon]
MTVAETSSAHLALAQRWISTQKPQISSLVRYGGLIDCLYVSIGRATINDLGRLCEIERECFTLEAFSRLQIAQLLENPHAISLVARVSSDIAGFIIGSIERVGEVVFGHIYTLDIAVKYRRKGIGMKLLNRLEQEFLEENVRECYLEARMNNTAALELYHKHGYARVKLLRNYYSKGSHGILLVKRLH